MDGGKKRTAFIFKMTDLQGTRNVFRVKTLEDLAIDAYLRSLEEVCESYVETLFLKSKLLARVRKQILSTTKQYFDNSLSGIFSSGVRQKMLARLFSVEFFGKTSVEQADQEEIELGHLDNWLKAVGQLLPSSSKECQCLISACISIPEIMLAVIVNEDLVDISFKIPLSAPLPVILVWYQDALVNRKGQVKLKKLTIEDDYEKTRECQADDMLEAHCRETIWSDLRDHEAEQLPCQSLENLFFEKNLFDKLTSLSLGIDINHESNFGLRLFRGIGIACPRLVFLDVSKTNLRSENLVYMLLEDPFLLLHHYLFKNWFKDRTNASHQHLNYCPWCPDDWCIDNVREGFQKKLHHFFFMDERLLQNLVAHYDPTIRSSLQNVITTKDLVKSLYSPIPWLVRPAGPPPWTSNFRAPPSTSNPVTDHSHFWCKPDGRSHYELKDPPGQTILPIAKSLKIIKMNPSLDSPIYEIVPFLLHTLPNLVSMGDTDVLRGLKMARDTGIEGINASTLLEAFVARRESLSLDQGWVERPLSRNQMLAFIEETNQLFRDHPCDPGMTLNQDLALLAKECPRLRKLHLDLTEDNGVGFESLQYNLPHLHDIEIKVHSWTSSVALLSVVGSKITKLSLTIKITSNDIGLDTILLNCPNLEHLTFSLASVDKLLCSSSGQVPVMSHHPNLRHLNILTDISKDVFLYIWHNAPNLIHLHVDRVVDIGTGFIAELGFNLKQWELSTQDVNQLFRHTPMSSLRHFDVMLAFLDPLAAQNFIMNLDDVEVIKGIFVNLASNPEHEIPQDQIITFRSVVHRRLLRNHVIEVQYY